MQIALRWAALALATLTLETQALPPHGPPCEAFLTHEQVRSSLSFRQRGADLAMFTKVIDGRPRTLVVVGATVPVLENLAPDAAKAFPNLGKATRHPSDWANWLSSYMGLIGEAFSRAVALNEVLTANVMAKFRPSFWANLNPTELQVELSRYLNARAVLFSKRTRKIAIEDLEAHLKLGPNVEISLFGRSMDLPIDGLLLRFKRLDHSAYSFDKIQAPDLETGAMRYGLWWARVAPIFLVGGGLMVHQYLHFPSAPDWHQPIYAVLKSISYYQAAEEFYSIFNSDLTGRNWIFPLVYIDVNQRDRATVANTESILCKNGGDQMLILTTHSRFERLRDRFVRDGFQPHAQDVGPHAPKAVSAVGM